jgi:uncharacterized protein (AIM24 family)
LEGRKGIQYKIEFPGNILLRVILDPNEELFAEPGSFVMYKGNVKMEAKTMGVFFEV